MHGPGHKSARVRMLRARMCVRAGLDLGGEEQLGIADVRKRIVLEDHVAHVADLPSQAATAGTRTL